MATGARGVTRTTGDGCGCAQPAVTRIAASRTSEEESNLNSPDTQLHFGKEIPDLEASRFRRVGPMNGIELDSGPVHRADRAGIGLGWISRAHEVTMALDRVVARQHQDDDRS